jgi:O-antigen/teichoic acid export membrane protein
LLGVSANAIWIVVRTLQQVALVPLFLVAWGAPLYGDWIAATAAASMLTLLEGGGQTYLVNRLNEEWTRGKISRFNGLFAIGMVFYSLVFLAGSLTVAAATMLPIAEWLKLTTVGSASAAHIVFWAGISVLLSLPSGFFAGAYRAIGEYHRGVLIGTAGAVTQLAVTMVLLSHRVSPDRVVFTLLIPIVVTTAYSAWDLHCRHPEIRADWRHVSALDLRAAVVPSLLFLLLPLSQIVWLQGSVLLVAELGTGAVALFSVSRTLFLLPRQILGQLNNAVWPEFTSMFAMSDASGLKRLNRSAMTISFVSTVMVTVFLIVFAPGVLTLWTRGRIVPDPTLLNMFGGYVLFGAFWQSQQIPLLASNRHRALAVRYLCGAITSIVVGAVLGRFLGARGVVVGMIAGELLFLTFWVGGEAARLVGDSWSGQLWSLLPRAAIATCLALGIATGLRLLVGTSTVTHAVASSILYGVAVGPLLWWCLESQDRRQLWSGTRRLMLPARAQV